MTTQPTTTATALVVCLGGKKFIPCDTFADASKAVRDYVHNVEKLIFIGGTEFYSKKNAGIIYHPTKGAFAYVSYNGRVWKGTDVGWNNGKPEEITDLTANDFEA